MERVGFFAPVTQAVRRALPHLPPPGSPPPILSLQDPRLFEQEMRAGGGFADVSIHSVTHLWEAPSALTLWESRRGAPGLVGFLESLQPQEQEAVGAALIDIMRQEFGNGPVRLEAEAHIGVGVKA